MRGGFIYPKKIFAFGEWNKQKGDFIYQSNMQYVSTYVRCLFYFGVSYMYSDILCDYENLYCIFKCADKMVKEIVGGSGGEAPRENFWVFT